MMLQPAGTARTRFPSEVKSEPVRVVHVVPNLCTGGMERLVLEMLRYRNPERVSARVLCIGTRGEFANEAENLGVPVEAWNAPIRRNLRLPLRLARRFRAVQAEIVHTHGPYAHLYGCLAARIVRGCGVVHTMHGFPWPRTWRRRLLSRLSNRITRRLVAVSHDLAHYAHHDLKAPPERLTVIHNGIDCSRFPTATDDESQKPYDAIMVARLSTEKDFDSLLEAADLVRRQRCTFKLAIVGDGPLRSQLEIWTDRLNLREHVCLLGNREDVATLLSQSKAFVLSTHTEGLSMALLEAMACGLPVVATAVGGNPEVIVEGQTGFLVPRSSPEALAEGLLKLLDDPQSASRMGIAGRRRIREYFDIRRMVESYEALYWACSRGEEVVASQRRFESFASITTSA